MKWLLHILVLLCIAAIAGCGGAPPPDSAPVESESEAPTPDPKLYAEWVSFLEHPEFHARSPRVQEVVRELKKTQPEKVATMVRLIGAKAMSPQQKVFIVQSVHGFVDSSHIPRLRRYYRSHEDATTRAAATTLLGYIDDPEALRILRHAVNDDEERVRFAARMGVARRGTKSDRNQFLERYWGGQLSAEERHEIIRFAIETPSRRSTMIMADAVALPETNPDLRIYIAAGLASHGDRTAIEALNEAISVSEDPVFSAVARSAVTNIRKRDEERKAAKKAEEEK